MERSQQTTQIQRIIRDYYQQLYANKMDNVKKMDKFLEKYNFPKLDPPQKKEKKDKKMKDGGELLCCPVSEN